MTPKDLKAFEKLIEKMAEELVDAIKNWNETPTMFDAIELLERNEDKDIRV